jgi:hypothetical protein
MKLDDIDFSKHGTTNIKQKCVGVFPVGLNVICVTDSTLMSDVRNTFEFLATTGRTSVGLAMPKNTPLRSVLTCGRRGAEQAKILAEANIQSAHPIQHTFEVVGTRDGFDVTSDEGLCVVQPFIENSKGCVSMGQVIEGPITPTFMDGLSRLRHTALRVGVRLMFFVGCVEGYKKTHLEKFCEEYVEISRCQPDPNAYAAYSIDCVGLRTLNSLGIGKKMCSVKLIDGKIRRNFTEFISDNLHTRIMWILRGHGKKFYEIGQIFDVDKATIWRRLQGLPPPKPIKVPDEWLNGYLDVARAIGKVEDDEGDRGPTSEDDDE